ncbi:MAG: type II toxin-antitoxin system RelE/ParE family toxin [Bacteroidota bacterium]
MIKRTEAAAWQIDALFDYYVREELVEAARNLIAILEALADEFEAGTIIGKMRPDLGNHGYLWVRRDPYLIAYLPPDPGDMEPCVIVTNVINASWQLAKHVKPVGTVVPWPA